METHKLNHNKKEILVQEIKAIFFDRGNTSNNCQNGPKNDEKSIIRNTRMLVKINSLYQEQFNIKDIEDEIINPWYSTFSERDIRGKEIRLEDYIESFLSKRELSYDHNTIEQIITEYAYPHIEWDIPNDGFLELITRLKEENIFVGILSNSAMPGYAYTPIYNHYNLSKYIDDYIFSYDVSMRKPDTKIFQHACDKNGFDPKKLYYGW
jgi:FMN phosphatase YigB (HAD superfamily)